MYQLLPVAVAFHNFVQLLIGLAETEKILLDILVVQVEALSVQLAVVESLTAAGAVALIYIGAIIVQKLLAAEDSD